MLAIIIFWSAIAFLAYTHIGYPLLLWAWARLRARPLLVAPAIAEPMASVSIIVVAYNEAARIEARLDNLLSLDYPRDRLEIILASDGSTDDTLARVQRYRNSGFRFVVYSRRRGKTPALNDLIPQARGDIVVLADARQRFAPDALRKLVRHFADPGVGAVSGELMLFNDAQSPAGEGVGFYWRYEKFIRRTESRIDSTVGATGAIYAIRRQLFELIPGDTLLDDVLIPMRIVRRGYRVLFEPEAFAYDRVAITAEVEFARKVRTLAGNFQLFVRSPWLLNPWINRLWLQTLSHKACRLLSPFCLAAVLGSNLLLLHDPFYLMLLAAQLALYTAAGCGHLLRNSNRKNRLLGVPYAFCLLNWAVVIGLFRFIAGRQRVTW